MGKLFRFFYPFGVAILASGVVVLESHGTHTDNFAQWTAVFVQGKFSDKYGYFLESQSRINDGWDYTNSRPNTQKTRGNRLLIRPALRWFPLADHKLQVFLGYGWTPNLSPFRDESRLWQQVLYQDKMNDRKSYMVRLRTEQRDIQGTKQIAHRVRLMGRLTHDMNTNWGITVWDEFFLGLNTVPGGPRAGSDQNRIFLGPVYKLSPMVRIEPGYMRVDYPRGTSSGRLTNHVASLSIFADI